MIDDQFALIMDFPLFFQQCSIQYKILVGELAEEGHGHFAARYGGLALQGTEYPG